MSDEKISQLSSGNPAQSGDLIPIDRSGSNFAVTAASIAALASGVATATISLSSSDLTGLRATPKTVVAAQAGKTLVPLFMQLYYHFVTTPYSGTSGNLFQLLPGGDIERAWDNGLESGGFSTQHFVNASSDQLGFSSLNTQSPALQMMGAPSVFQNQPLQIGFGANQGAAPLSVGDGTVDVTVFYIVV